MELEETGSHQYDGEGVLSFDTRPYDDYWEYSFDVELDVGGPILIS